MAHKSNNHFKVKIFFHSFIILILLNTIHRNLIILIKSLKHLLLIQETSFHNLLVIKNVKH